MTSSKVVRTLHHISRFLRRSLVLKIKLNTGQTPGTTTDGNNTNVVKYEGRDLLNVETLKTLYFCIELFQPKISLMLSFSGMYQKPIIYRRNRTNSQ